MIRRSELLMMLLLLLCAWGPLSAAAQPFGEPARAGESITQKTDGIFAPLVGEKTPGVAVLVRKDGRTVFVKGYGLKEIKEAEEVKEIKETHGTGKDSKPVAANKIDGRTNFRLASCTKQFTAMAVMLLVRDGKLRYEEPLAEIFPEFPAYGRGITIRHLLTHTSGLPDYEVLMQRAESRARDNHVAGQVIWSEERQIQDAEVLKLLEQESAGNFAPGTSWSYSNSGYVVLGLVVAKVSGKPFAEFLRERIFAPLGMSGTVVYEKGKNEVANRTYGYTRLTGAGTGHSEEGEKLQDTVKNPTRKDGVWGTQRSKDGEKFRLTDQSATSATLGDGGVYSSLADLAKWDEALARGTLLSAEEMRPALTAVRLADGSEPKWPSGREADSDNLHPGQPVVYGFGWFLDPYRGHARIYHHGGTTGFRSYIARFVQDGLTVVVLCNRTDLDPEELGLRVADLWLQ